jgi:hypothetical protein
VSEIAVAWVAVRPSPWQRRLRLASRALAAATVALLATIWLTEAQAYAWSAAAIAASLAAAAPQRGAPPALRWRIDGEGRLAVLVDGAEYAASAAFVSPLLIVLRYGRRPLGIWRDAAPTAAFRRLSAAARWRIERRPAAELESSRP